jgi:hypothetical protein
MNPRAKLIKIIVVFTWIAVCVVLCRVKATFDSQPKFDSNAKQFGQPACVAKMTQFVYDESIAGTFIILDLSNESQKKLEYRAGERVPAGLKPFLRMTR